MGGCYDNGGGGVGGAWLPGRRYPVVVGRQEATRTTGERYPAGAVQEVVKLTLASALTCPHGAN